MGVRPWYVPILNRASVFAFSFSLRPSRIKDSARLRLTSTPPANVLNAPSGLGILYFKLQTLLHLFRGLQSSPPPFIHQRFPNNQPRTSNFKLQTLFHLFQPNRRFSRATVDSLHHRMFQPLKVSSGSPYIDRYLTYQFLLPGKSTLVPETNQEF